MGEYILGIITGLLMCFFMYITSPTHVPINDDYVVSKISNGITYKFKYELVCNGDDYKIFSDSIYNVGDTIKFELIKK